MKKNIFPQSTSQESARKMRGARRPLATLMAVFALITCASSSALATQCEWADFTETGQYPSPVYVDVTTKTPGATIFVTVGSDCIPANPTHGSVGPTGSTFLYGGTFVVTAGQYIYIKAVVHKAGMTDSVTTYYEVNNKGY